MSIETIWYFDFWSHPIDDVIVSSLRIDRIKASIKNLNLATVTRLFLSFSKSYYNKIFLSLSLKEVERASKNEINFLSNVIKIQSTTFVFSNRHRFDVLDQSLYIIYNI